MEGRSPSSVPVAWSANGLLHEAGSERGRHRNGTDAHGVVA
ncbi:hypothetical protein AKJ09_02717 [Labilithrix luteola]|uniref:Uncharacterized protein n=1 Tax=Labilithrix luteola TaxID=1391654 RepID=A0A0K1PR92_9BACT|nr:hypothetical protein AKJ09_02717 [Labilithrix luteola]